MVPVEPVAFCLKPGGGLQASFFISIDKGPVLLSNSET
jgi:hypothetical protein